MGSTVLFTREANEGDNQSSPEIIDVGGSNFENSLMTILEIISASRCGISPTRINKKPVCRSQQPCDRGMVYFIYVKSPFLSNHLSKLIKA